MNDIKNIIVKEVLIARINNKERNEFEVVAEALNLTSCEVAEIYNKEYYRLSPKDCDKTQKHNFDISENQADLGILFKEKEISDYLINQEARNKSAMVRI